MASADRRMAWGSSEDSKLREMFDQGKFYAEIGFVLSRSSSAVFRRVQALKLTREHPIRVDKFWDTERDHRLIELSKSDWGRTKIARELGTSEWSVRYRQKELGIKIPGTLEAKRNKGGRPKKPEPIFGIETETRSFIVQDERFQSAMLRGIEAGERCFVGVVTTPGTRSPKWVTPE